MNSLIKSNKLVSSLNHIRRNFTKDMRREVDFHGTTILNVRKGN